MSGKRGNRACARSPIAAIGAALIAVAVLAGCSTAQGVSAAPTSGSTSAATAGADPTVGATDAPPATSDAGTPLAAGDPVPDGTQLGAGQYAYTVPGQGKVLVEANQPLPPAVQQNLEAQQQAIPQGTTASTDARGQASSVASGAQSATGHPTLVLISFKGYNQDGALVPSWQLVSSKGGALDQHKYNYLDQGAVIAYGQQYIASQPDAANWVFLY